MIKRNKAAEAVLKELEQKKPDKPEPTTKEWKPYSTPRLTLREQKLQKPK